MHIKCKVDNCNKKDFRKGLCQVHCKEQFPEAYEKAIILSRAKWNRWGNKMKQDPEWMKQRLEQKKNSYYKLLPIKRHAVLMHYSNKEMKCVCCNERTEEFLSIDHINGHSDIDDFTGYKFYHWLVMNNFPPGYRVLCHNCNQAYGYYGYCPHNKQTG